MRLIDADALIEFVEGRYTVTWNHDYDGGIKDACIDILNFIDNAPTIDAVPHWIPYGERLPREKEVVLITNSEGNVRCGQFRGTSGKHWFWIGNTLEMVEAWMPLPEPYGGERRDDEIDRR